MAELDEQQITITLPDGSERSYGAGTTGRDIAESIGAGLARDALAIKVNGEVRDLDRPITEDAEIAILTWDDEEGKQTFWHSSAHLMAEALQALYPEVKFTIGPPIDQGFYYDVDLGDKTLSSDELEEIEAKMQELARRDVAYERHEVSKDDALEYYENENNEYKLELIEDLEEGEISFYEQGGFTDLCRGPHVPEAEAADGLPGAAAQGQGARPPQAGPGVGSVHVRHRAGGAGPAHVAAQRHHAAANPPHDAAGGTDEAGL